MRLGEHDVTKAEDLKPNALQPFTVQDIEVEKAIAYPHYDKQKRLNDIGLVRLKSPADLEKPNINVICLPAEGESQFELLDNIDPLIKNNLIIAGLKIPSMLSKWKLNFYSLRLGKNRESNRIGSYVESKSGIHQQRKLC